jgi:hypothetical protein
MLPLLIYCNLLGVLSVFGQHIDHLSSALRVLDQSSDNQYGIRGQPRFDKVTFLSYCLPVYILSTQSGTRIFYDVEVTFLCRSCFHDVSFLILTSI